MHKANIAGASML